MIFNRGVHEEIGSWRQGAEAEDSKKYFFETPEIAKLRSGEKLFVIGRKGSGKSAMGQAILKNSTPGTFAWKLSFKNHPFNELYPRLRDDAFTRPNHYISGWRFVIYCAVAKMMASNEKAPASTRKFIQRLFPDDVRAALATTIARWVSGGFRLRLFSFGLEAKAARQFANANLPLAERADTLRSFLLRQEAPGTYYLVFDQLDEDYSVTKNAEEREEYFALLGSLFKAALAVADEFSKSPSCVLPIVLLRDDIFDQVQSNDRNKWMDWAVEPRWTIDRIKEMLAFRLSRAADLPAPLRFPELWGQLVGQHPRFTVNKEWDKFDFIASYTLLRPRDFIYYIADASRRIADKMKAGSPSAVLSGDVLKECGRDFANHLRRELQDEIGVQIPYIREVLDMILHFEDRHFSLAEFTNAYEREVQRATGTPWTLPGHTVLNFLYLFSAIGFMSGPREVYRYQNPNIDLDPSKKMLLHKGLLGARRIV